MRALIVAATALISGCAADPTPQVAQHAVGSAPACAAQTFPANERIGAWSVDKFAGRYARKDGGTALVVRRNDHRLLIDRGALGTRELTADSIESWTWRDGCGATYAFSLPPDGPGAWLVVTDPGGARSEWHRTGY